MPMFQALELCPQATVDPARHGEIQACQRRRSARIFPSATSIIEPVSLDEAYLDLTDDYRTEAPPAAEALALIATARRARGRHHRFDRPLVQQVPGQARLRAGEAARLLGHRPGEAKSFLAPLSVRKIHGVGAVTARRMEESGLKTIADLQALQEQAAGRTLRQVRPPARALRARRGRPQRSRPIAPSRAFPPRPPSRRTPARASTLREMAGGLCDRVARPARAQGCGRPQRGAEAQDVRLPHPHAQPAPRRIPPSAADVIWESVARHRSRGADGRTFRLIGVGAADIKAAARADPMDLFSFGTGQNE